MRRAAAFALPALLLAGCAAASQAPAQTDALTIENRYPLEYATQFTVDVCAGGYDLITIDGSRYLVVPEGAAAPADLDADITVLQQPIQNIYLVSSSAMDPIISIGGLGAVALSGTQAENWYLDAARTAMEQGEIAYAGKYSAPDYETILSADCGLAIENTMIYHTPEVKEQLEKFGVPVRAFSVVLVLLSSLLAACVTAFAGPISFVGIAVPHLVKHTLDSAKPLRVLPGCALGGAAFCLLCDLIARSLFAPTELSISSVTAVFGAPVVIWLLVRRHSGEGTV